MQKEIDALNKKRKAVIKANSVKTDFPKLDKTFTYKKTTVIKSSDIASL